MATISLLRQKILEQAMRGELTPQNDGEGNSEELLEMITEYKGKSKRYKNIEQEPYSIPSNWQWVRLGNYAEVIMGQSPPSESYNEEGKGMPFYQGKADFGNMFPTARKWCTQPKKIAIKNDILLSVRAPVGTVNICNEESCIGRGVTAIRTLCGGNHLFLYYYLQAIEKQIEEQGTGTTFKAINSQAINELPVPIPPIKEQERIVARIEELLSLCEHLEWEVEFQQKHIRRLREKVLEDALQGLLVTQNEDAEPASIILQKIRKEREQLIKDKKIRKTKPLPVIEQNEVPHEIPLGWTWVRIGDIATINPRNAIDDDLEVGFVPMRLIEDGYSGKHVSEPRKWKDVKRGFTHFQENDIAIAKITPCFENKKSTIMRDLPNGYGAGTTELHIVRPFHEYVLVDYLMCLFKSNTFIEKGVQTYTGTAGQQRVGKDFIENYVIGLPPIEEQHRIVDKVKNVWETINQIENNIVLTN